MVFYQITYQRVPDRRVPDQSVPHKGSRKKGSRSNFGTFLVRPAQFSKRPEWDTLNVHKSRMYTTQYIHMGVWDHMKCIPIWLPNIWGGAPFPPSSPVPSIKKNGFEKFGSKKIWVKKLLGQIFFRSFKDLVKQNFVPKKFVYEKNLSMPKLVCCQTQLRLC